MYNIYLKIEDRIHEINSELEGPNTSDGFRKLEKELNELVRHEIHLKEQRQGLEDYLTKENDL